ncbi:hypothetical protein A11A3_13625, partial [Alcanivorax hongdengensis A-11-3]
MATPATQTPNPTPTLPLAGDGVQVLPLNEGELEGVATPAAQTPDPTPTLPLAGEGAQFLPLNEGEPEG